MQPGQLLCDRYRIEKALAKGGFGETFLAVDTHLPSKPQVVVKLLKPIYNDPDTLKIAQRLFNMEAETLEQLGKDNDRIPSLYAYFELKGEFYLVQEYIEGETLTEELQEQQISESDTLAIIQEILIGLTNVHREGKIHRDLKPDNIIRRDRERKLVLIDFGAVKQFRTATTNPNLVSSTITIGTPGYMPTEQGMGCPRLASDIYAVGAIGIQCLTGSAPHLLFNEDSLSIEWQHLLRVDRDFAKVLNKMVAPDYHQRYVNATEALKAIESLNISSAQQIKPPPIAVQPPIITLPVVRLPSTRNVRPKSRIFPSRKDYFFGSVAGVFTIGVIYAIRSLAILFNSDFAVVAEPVVTPSPAQPLPTLAPAKVTPKSSKKPPTLLDKSAITSTPSTTSSTLDESVVLPTSVSKSLSQLSSQVSALEKSIDRPQALSAAEKAKLTSIKAQLIAVSNNIKSGNIANAKTQFEKINFSTLETQYYSTESMWDIRVSIMDVELDMISSIEDIDAVKVSKDLTEAIRLISNVTNKK
jgi:serine/threonine protein kinase